MTDIVNLQRKIAIDLDEFRKFSQQLTVPVAETDGRPFAVAFISDRRMKSLNETFRGKSTTTDVLSFANQPEDFELNASSTHADGNEEPSLGDVVISVEQAQKQAEENGLTLEGEIKQLILHGLLHLCGYDHETDDGEMNGRELELREQLGI